jgi:hypothetical protein
MDGRVLTASGELLYSDVVGRDACGIGGVASKDGTPSNTAAAFAARRATVRGFRARCRKASSASRPAASAAPT